VLQWNQLIEANTVIERLQQLGHRAPALDRPALRASIAVAIDELQAHSDATDRVQSIDAALATCRHLYGHARSAEALSLARVAFDHASELEDRELQRKAATVCGILAADTLDLVAAVDYHVIAFRVSGRQDDVAEGLRFWNNIGLAMGIGGHYALAAKCYRRALDVCEGLEGPVQNRWAALMNLSMCLLRTGASEEGLPYALRALEEETPEFVAQDPHGALFLRRNLAALLIGCGRVDEAARYVEECAKLGSSLSTSRAQVSVASTRAIFELAKGSTDVALTRLEQALALAREVPAAMHDTLVAAIRAEEAAGQYERALERVEELSQHVYRFGVERARSHIELAHLDPANNEAEQEQLQARARLLAKTAAREVPEAWSPLERLAVSAVMRMDATGLHGKRVGALVKGLAFASGSDSLQALEMGLAAELHDIGMLSVPDTVLRKVESLNDAERGIVGRHVEAGVEILGDDAHPRVFLGREIARYHHARWDGEGHPGIGGRRIPIAARICAIADAYDAMVFGLGSRSPRSMDDALAEIGAEAGGQFDPDLVDAFDGFIRTESEDVGVDLSTSPGMAEFESLITALQDDRGFA
jgi:putative two-component system response regulator